MSGRVLIVGTLATLVQAKAIITNHCPQAVYVWSVPNVGSAHTENLPINPGGRYEEPWRYGTSEHPGIALKISTEANGIHKGMDEIDFAYSVDHSDKSKIWIDLSPVRGNAYNNLAFHTCHGIHESADVQTGQCEATDNIELVLCSTTRSSRAKDTTWPDQIFECYNYHQDNDKYDHSKPIPQISTQPHSVANHTCAQCPPPKPISTGPYPKPYHPAPYVPPHEHTTTVIVTKHATVTQPAHEHTATHYAPPVHKTVTYHAPPEHKTVTLHAPPERITVTYHEPPKYTPVPVHPAPLRPSYPHGERPTEPIGDDEYDVPRPNPYSDDRSSQSDSRVYDSKFHYQATSPKSHDYCKPKVTYPRPVFQLKNLDNNGTASRNLNGRPLDSFKANKRCVLPWCEPLQPGLNCTAIAKQLTQRDLGLTEWTDHESVCSKRKPTFWSPKTALKNFKKPKKCVLPFCEPVQPGITCADVEEALE